MRKEVKAAMKGLVENDHKFLVIELKLGKETFWDLPGGKVEFGEDPVDTLVREMDEETGLKVTPGPPAGIYYFFRKTDGHQVVCTVYRCSVPGKLQVILPHASNENIQQYKWVTKDEFQAKEYKVSHESIKEFFKGL
jgi:8-oxo-dGTP pyrophosphatase MutT (NUDIX family)